jgi:hypothetical protein
MEKYIKPEIHEINPELDIDEAIFLEESAIDILEAHAFMVNDTITDTY